MRYIKCKKIKGNLVGVEEDIKNYIMQYDGKEFLDILKYDDRWEVFFHLSPLREAIFEWYEFCPEARILEIGGGFGALTGILCRKSKCLTVTEDSLLKAECIAKRYNQMDNLTIYAGDPFDVNFDQTFDYIVFSGSFEAIKNEDQEQSTYVNYLKKFKNLLSPNGKILLMTNNRYGLKYFCGEADDYTQQSFGGINKYSQIAKGHCFDQEELKTILALAGIRFFKFYYPMPDYAFTQVIYSDDHLPKDEIRERVIFYCNNGRRLIDESFLYSDLVRNKVFSFFSNSFFVECGKKEKFYNPDYATITVDRGSKRSFITSIYKKNIVKKRAVWDDGIEGLKVLNKNLQSLKKRNVSVLEGRIKGNSMYMPYVKAMTLAQYLRTLGNQDRQIYFSIYDRLWEKIIQSSDLTFDLSVNFDNLLPKFTWGPILKKAYIEMIPMNCFYEKNDFVFFDQEFTFVNCPAKYVMFRALAFIYPELELDIPLSEIQSRYNITQELWDAFWIIEAEFYNSLKNINTQTQLHIRKITSDQVMQNCEKFSMFDKIDYDQIRENDRREFFFEREDFFSFNLADILITRRVGNNKGIFLLMQREMKKEKIFSERMQKVFCDLRVYYEKVARKESLLEGEVTLEDIYQFLASAESLTKEQVEYLMSMEKNFEFKNVVGIKTNINRVKYLLKNNKRVVIISDSYMDKNTIYKMLEKADPILKNIPIYISSNFGKTKESGNLYKLVQTCEKISVSHWVHCGNDVIKDKKAAEALGIATLIEPVTLNATQQLILAKRENNLEIQMLIGEHRIKYLSNEYSFKHKFIEEKLLAKINTEKNAIQTSLNIPLSILKDKIVVYGAGIFGQKVYVFLNQLKIFHLIEWVDKDYVSKQKLGLPVKSPTELENINFDQILIAVKSYETIGMIKNDLISAGIDRGKIINYIF